jgi:D-alanyl-D-alanine carboxypeptidase
MISVALLVHGVYLQRMEVRKMSLSILTTRLFLALLVSVLVILAACSRSSSPEEAEANLEAMLNRTVARAKGVRNAVLLVDAPKLGVNGAWAAGIAYEDSGTAMTVQTPFLSASVGKLFTSSLILSMVEEGVLSLDDSIVDWLDPSLITGLPVEGGEASLDEITVRRLLTHRSGLPDYFEGRTADGVPNIFELITEAPERRWTPRLVLDYTKEHYEPAGKPGEVFLYADTNYDLLGFIVEADTGKPFQEVMTERIFQPLGLANTWMHAFSDADYADAWIEDFNAAGTPALTLEVAGGGLATTVGDLQIFLRSLLNGQPVALESLQNDWTEDALTKGIDYAYGLWRIRPGGLFFLLKGYPEMLGASGSSGSFLYWVPEYEAVIAGSFNQTKYAQKHVAFLIKVLRELSRVTPAVAGA